MRVSSSKLRQFRKRVAYSAESLLGTLVVAVIGLYVLSDTINIDFLKVAVAFSILCPLLVTAWLALFAPTDGETILLDDSGLHFESYGDRESIPWGELAAIKGPKGLRREVKFSASSGTSIRLSTLAFTHEEWSSVMREVALRAPHAV